MAVLPVHLDGDPLGDPDATMKTVSACLFIISSANYHLVLSGTCSGTPALPQRSRSAVCSLGRYRLKPGGAHALSLPIVQADPHLAVLNLAERSRILARHPNRMFALLRKACVLRHPRHPLGTAAVPSPPARPLPHQFLQGSLVTAWKTAAHLCGSSPPSILPEVPGRTPCAPVCLSRRQPAQDVLGAATTVHTNLSFLPLVAGYKPIIAQVSSFGNGLEQLTGSSSLVCRRV